jgi:CheY-like chemotaxis protein
MLLAEDIEANQEIARAVLEAAGHTVDIAANGYEAVRLVRNGYYDLVLMDVHMPGMDGIAATRRIRGLPGPERNIPIIAMTANVLPEQVEDFIDAGMNDHVGKPFDRGELYRLIDRWLPEVMIVDTGAASARDELDAEMHLFDEKVYGDLAQVLGKEKMIRLLDKLAEILQSSLSQIPDRTALAREAHSLISQAGMLGFTELSEACRSLENACLAEENIDAPLAAVSDIRQKTLREIGRLRGALQSAA